MSRVIREAAGVGLLAYPPPFACWVALSSDPDHTRAADWREIHALLWESLQLPFADSFFIRNKNLQKADQVSLVDNPEIAGAHPHDTMHTWGDYIFTGAYRFTRKDAECDLQRLRELGLTPRVWTDHSNFAGNLLHRPSTSVVPVTKDSSGHEYVNEVYTLDLARQAGIAYVWDGTIGRRLPGQDRPVSRWDWYRRRYRPMARAGMVMLDALSGPVARLRNPAVFDFSPDCHRQYSVHEFPDGTRIYKFPRYGSWALGDIDGLASVLAPSEVARLERGQGTAIVYTHLGKRAGNRVPGGNHVPPATVEALTHLAERYRRGAVNLSGTATLLDYLVLRDHLRLEPGVVHFRSDGIRFNPLTEGDLAGHSFGLTLKHPRVRVLCDGRAVDRFTLEPVGGCHRLRFE